MAMGFEENSPMRHAFALNWAVVTKGHYAAYGACEDPETPRA
jgi:hypothetical protein